MLPRIKIDLEFFLAKTEYELMLSRALVFAKISNTGHFKLRGKLFVVIERDSIDSFIEVEEYPNFLLKFSKHTSKEIHLRESEESSLKICEAFGQGHRAVLHQKQDWSRFALTSSDIKKFTVIFRPGLMIGKKLRLIPLIKIKKEFDFINDLGIPTTSKILESGANPAWISSKFYTNKKILSQLILNGETDEERKAKEFKKVAHDVFAQKKREILESLIKAGATAEEQSEALEEIGIKSIIVQSEGGKNSVFIEDDEEEIESDEDPEESSNDTSQTIEMIRGRTADSKSDARSYPLVEVGKSS